MVGLPGLLLGSLLGPTLNEIVGSRNIMKIFLVFITWDFCEHFYKARRRLCSGAQPLV